MVFLLTADMILLLNKYKYVSFVDYCNYIPSDNPAGVGGPEDVTSEMGDPLPLELFPLKASSERKLRLTSAASNILASLMACVLMGRENRPFRTAVQHNNNVYSYRDGIVAILQYMYMFI